MRSLYRFEKTFTVVKATPVLRRASLAYLLFALMAIFGQPGHTQNDPNRSFTTHTTKGPDVDRPFHVQLGLFEKFITSMALGRT